MLLYIISRLQEKAFQIINFKQHDTPSNSLFKENKFLKISDFIKYENKEFVRKYNEMRSSRSMEWNPKNENTLYTKLWNHKL